MTEPTPLTAEEEARVRDWIAATRIRGIKPMLLRLLDTLDATRQPASELDRQWFYDGLPEEADDEMYRLADSIFENVSAHVLARQPAPSEGLRRAFADAFMRHPTGRMNDMEVMAVLDEYARQPASSEGLCQNPKHAAFGPHIHDAGGVGRPVPAPSEGLRET